MAERGGASPSSFPVDASLASLRRAVFRFAERGAALSALYHRARRVGAEHLPREGPAPRVGNHGVDKYRLPRVVGLGPRPLPARPTFAVGAPHAPPPPDAPDSRLRAFRGRGAASLVRSPRPLAYVFAPTVARVLGGPHLPPEGRAEIVREARRLSSLEPPRRLRDVLAADFPHRLHEIRVPTLILQGAGRQGLAGAPLGRAGRGPAHPRGPPGGAPGGQPPAVHEPLAGLQRLRRRLPPEARGLTPRPPHTP